MLTRFFVLLGIAIFCLSIEASGIKKDETSKPNVVIIFTDDQGYQDLGCYDSPKIKTPNIDKMAEEGIRFTDFYVSASVCSPSRASLLTGKYSFGNGVGGVVFPDRKGMDPQQVTLAEVLKTAGYATACFGKWHLGDLETSLPLNQGFDEYFGIPYSNDMFIGVKQKFADSVNFRNGYTLQKAREDQEFIKENYTKRKKIAEYGIKELVPLFEGNKIVEYPCDQATLTKRYFDRAFDFIEKNDENPFFVYLAPAMPHVPLFASEEFKNTSERGLYGDVIEEIDWNVGELVNYLEKNELDENTMIIFTSDNGPWLGYGDHAGSAEPLRDGKFTNYEGGVRVPCVMYWPGQWDRGKVSHEIVSTVDFFPTIANYAGAEYDRVHGIDISSHLENTDNKLSRDYVLYTKNTDVHGIRKGDWKYLPYSGERFADRKEFPPQLFNLKEDVSEKNNLYDTHPDIARDLEEEMRKIEMKLKEK
ncbi:sulfatase family protein [Thermophagus sp. OGC60D27]|uniref:sulfatase family protein n=1 Tax=Thermophagus sp. OGC60D27 TaxID=3458415 RepID=UPI0040383E07